MNGLRHGILAATILVLILAAPIDASSQGARKLADTFEERYPPQENPTPIRPEQAPRRPPAEQAPVRPDAERDNAQQNRFPEANKHHLPHARQNRPPDDAQPKKGVNVTTPTRAVTAKRSPSRVVVVPRSFLDAGTEVLPGERKFLNYAFPRTHTAMDVVTNTGGRVGWHNSPLPGPLFPGPGPW